MRASLVALATACLGLNATRCAPSSREAAFAEQIRPLLVQAHRDTVPPTDRPPIWEAVLRFYRSGRTLTEADRAARAHAHLGIEPKGSLTERAPVVLATRRQALVMFDTLTPAPFDTTWLRQVSDRHLVAGLCSERSLDLCPDSVLTTYLSLDDPRTQTEGGVVVEVWETALNPVLCRTRDVIVDREGVSVNLSRTSGEWAVSSIGLRWHVTTSCSLIRKSR
jgi:hypothetical protein